MLKTVPGKLYKQNDLDEHFVHDHKENFPASARLYPPVIPGIRPAASLLHDNCNYWLTASPAGRYSLLTICRKMINVGFKRLGYG